MEMVSSKQLGVLIISKDTGCIPIFMFSWFSCTWDTQTLLIFYALPPFMTRFPWSFPSLFLHHKSTNNKYHAVVLTLFSLDFLIPPTRL